jgi:hypothetical protein
LVSAGVAGLPGLGFAAAQRGVVVEAEKQSAATIDVAARRWRCPERSILISLSDVFRSSLRG